VRNEIPARHNQSRSLNAGKTILGGGMIDRKRFYECYRKHFINKLNQGQVNGFEAIFDFYEKQGYGEAGLPYVLATAYHETGGIMLPVREGFANSDEESIRIVTRMYQQGRITQNYATPDSETGKSYFGRGLVQITHKDNYRRAGEAIGADLMNNPDLALDLATAVRILVVGMHEGLFTGKKLVDYIDPMKNLKDYFNARRIVNWLDKAGLIAGYATRFEECLKQ